MDCFERQGCEPYTATQAGALGLFEGVPDVPASAGKFFSLLAAVILGALALAFVFHTVMSAFELGHLVIPTILAGTLLVSLKLGIHRAILGLIAFHAPPPSVFWIIDGFSPPAVRLLAPQAVVWPVGGLERPPRRSGAA